MIHKNLGKCGLSVCVEISKAVDMYMFLFDDILLLARVKKPPRKARLDYKLVSISLSSSVWNPPDAGLRHCGLPIKAKQLSWSFTSVTYWLLLCSVYVRSFLFCCIGSLIRCIVVLIVQSVCFVSLFWMIDLDWPVVPVDLVWVKLVGRGRTSMLGVIGGNIVPLLAESKSGRTWQADLDLKPYWSNKVVGATSSGAF